MLVEAERGRGGGVLVMGRVGSRSKKEGFGEMGGSIWDRLVLRLKEEDRSAEVAAVGHSGFGMEGS